MKICLHQIKKYYKNRLVLDIGHLELECGKVTALIGQNGSGKSTFLKILAGFIHPEEGRVICGETLQHRNIALSYLPQKPYIFDITVLRNVTMGLENDSMAVGRVTDALKTVGLEEMAQRKAKELSGGELQRVAFARMLVQRRELYIMDEPTAPVDMTNTHRIEEAIRTLNQDHSATVVFSTHFPSQAARLADHVIFFKDGKILEMGTPNILIQPGSAELKEFLLHWRV